MQINCQHCSAPIEIGDGERIIKCTTCERMFVLPARSTLSAFAAANSKPPEPMNRNANSGGIVLIALLLLAVIVVGAVSLLMRSKWRMAEAIATSVQADPLAATDPLNLAAAKPEEPVEPEPPVEASPASSKPTVEAPPDDGSSQSRRHSPRDEVAPDPAPTPADLPTRPSASDVRHAIRDISSDLTACAPTAQGVAMLVMTIDGPSGSVQAVQVSGDFADRPEAACIARAARRAQFPRFASPALTINYPFRF